MCIAVEVARDSRSVPRFLLGWYAWQDREELFAYKINWQVVEAHNIIQSKMRPWIVKKIIEYLGEEEKTLTEFILTKLEQRALPQVRVCGALF